MKQNFEALFAIDPGLVPWRKAFAKLGLNTKIYFTVERARVLELPPKGKKYQPMFICAETEGGRRRTDTAFQLDGHLVAFMRFKDGPRFIRPVKHQWQLFSRNNTSMIAAGLKNTNSVLKRAFEKHAEGFFSVSAPEQLGLCGLLLTQWDLGQRGLVGQPVFAVCGPHSLFVADEYDQEAFCSMLEHCVRLRGDNVGMQPWSLYLPSSFNHNFRPYAPGDGCTATARSILRKHFPDNSIKPQTRESLNAAKQIRNQFVEATFHSDDGRVFRVISNLSIPPRS